MYDVETYGDGEPVVLLHGVPVPPESLEPLRRRLEQSHRVVVPDMTAIDRDPVEALEPLEETLISEGVEQAPVVGHSFGAYRAFQLALSDAVDVDRIAAIGALAHLPDPVRAQYDELIEGFEADAIDLPEVLAGQWFGDGYLADEPEAVEMLEQWFEEVGREGVISGGRTEVRGPDLRPRLDEIDVPVYLQTGDEDEATPVDWAREIAETIPNNRCRPSPSFCRGARRVDSAALKLSFGVPNRRRSVKRCGFYLRGQKTI
ncbi:MAG: alpha/beta fold hydrolase [Bradymonadaceae bacterium]